MGRKRTAVAVLAAALLAGLLVAPATPALAKSQQHIVSTKHGDLYVQVWLPDAGSKRVPTILTYSPYSAAGRGGDESHWLQQGYAHVWADVPGTGNSGGCFDYGGKREKEAGYELVEWIAKQKWSNGKVAMTGTSYNGSTAVGVATLRPPHLTTIVPVAATTSKYDYLYSGGIRYSWNNEVLSHEGAAAAFDNNIDTPLLLDFGFALPPPDDPSNENWAQRVQTSITPCDELEHTEHGYDQTPDYDKFWRERDYVKDAGDIRIPVLLAHNWGDWNVKPDHAIELYGALDRSPNVKLFMGSRWDGHGAPGGDFVELRDAWLAHYLKGADNRAEKMPRVTSQTADHDGARKWHKGGWPKTQNVELIAQEAIPTQLGDYIWKLLPSKPLLGLKTPAVSQFPSAGINSESHAAHHCRSNHDWWCFETLPFARDTRIFGEIKVEIYSTVQREWVTYTPSIIDVDPSGHRQVGNQHVGTDPKNLVAVTRGWLDSRYRKSLAKQVPIDEPGQPFSMTVVTKPQDYTFKKGHYIWLNIQTEINEWSLPKPYPCDEEADPTTCAQVRINWQEGKTRLVLPVVGAPKDPMDLFDMGHHH